MLQEIVQAICQLQILYLLKTCFGNEGEIFSLIKEK